MDNPQPNNEPPGDEPEKEKSFFGIIVHSFFIIPFLIAVFCVMLFAAINLLTRERQTVYDYLEDVKTGGSTKRWQAAFELSKFLANPELVPDEKRFNSELIHVFQKSRHDDNRVRQYLALAMGRTGKSAFFEPLVEDIKTEKEENLYAIIYALGMLRDDRAVEILHRYVNHTNSRIRSVTVVALGSIADKESKEILKKALNDPEANVQWGSAISLAQMKDAAGSGVIAQLLSREYLNKFSEVDAQETNHLMLAAIEAASLLNQPELNDIIKKLSQSDQNMKVRAAAIEYIKKK